MRPHRPVGLEEAPLAALVDVLGLGEVGHLRLDARAAERLEVFLAELEPLADEPRLVAPDDEARLVPDLDARDAVAEDVVADHRVHLGPRLRVAVDEGVGEGRLEQRVGDAVGTVGRVGDRLGLGQAAGGHERRDGDGDDDEQGDDGDPDDDATGAGVAGRASGGAVGPGDDLPGRGGRSGRCRRRGGGDRLAVRGTHHHIIADGRAASRHGMSRARRAPGAR